MLLAALGASGEIYRENFRPQYHFSPRTNWTNDPCGLVFANGEYHLFFQYNPLGDLWGHMSWGHAVSRDLVRWQERPVAIPEGGDAMIFTGSSVVDTRNSSGLCRPGTPCIVSVYTGHMPKSDKRAQRQAQHLAASQDGITWKKFEGNPVLDVGLADFRDPKVFWDAPRRQWVMVVVLPQAKKVRFYASPNLKAWTALSDFGPAGATGGVWECPDLFELPVDGNPAKTRWILKVGLNPGHVAGGSGEQYFVGSFDGKQFVNEAAATETRWLDYGRDCYCALTWNGEDKTRHMIGWMNNWQYARQIPTQPWRGAMTLPRTLELHSSAGGLQLVQSPVAALRSLRGEKFAYRGKSIADLNTSLAKWRDRTQTFEIEAEIQAGSASQVLLKFLESSAEFTLVGFDRKAKQVFVDRTKSGVTEFSRSYPSKTVAPLTLGTGSLKLRIFVDRSSVEVFCDQGRVVLTNLVFPGTGSKGISVTTEGGETGAIDWQMWNLRSIWPSGGK